MFVITCTIIHLSGVVWTSICMSIRLAHCLIFQCRIFFLSILILPIIVPSITNIFLYVWCAQIGCVSFLNYFEFFGFSVLTPQNHNGVLGTDIQSHLVKPYSQVFEFIYSIKCYFSVYISEDKQESCLSSIDVKNNAFTMFSHRIYQLLQIVYIPLTLIPISASIKASW